MAAADARGRGAAAWLAAPRPVPHPWLVFGLLALLLLARQPQDLLRPQFNAEEGFVFFQQAFADGFLPSLFSAEAGYYHLALRLTAGLALLVPLELAPLAFKLVAFAIQMLPIAYLLADDVVGVVATPAFRVALAFVCLAGPNTDEVYLNVNNSQWHLALAACLILLSGPRAGRLRRAVDAAVLALFAGSGPFSLVCAPLALWAWRRARAAGAGRAGSVGPLIVLAGAGVQLAYLLAGTRAAPGAAGFGLPSPAEIVRILALHGTCNALFGKTFTTRWHAAFPGAMIVAAAAALPAFAVAAVRLRNAALLTLLGLATVSALVMFLFPLNDPRRWLDPNFGPRYFYFTMLFLLATLLAAAERGRRWRWCALPGLACALVLGVGGDFRIVPAPDSHWPDQVAVFRTLPQGTAFFIPVYPQPSGWGLTLRRAQPPDGPDPLGKYPPSGQPALAAVESIGAPPLPGAGAGELVLFTGYAVDAARRAPAGGVFLQIDDALFPAVTGLPSPRAAAAAGDPALGAAGFARAVPRARIGAGAHSLRLLVLDRSRAALLEAGPRTFFTAP